MVERLSPTVTVHSDPVSAAHALAERLVALAERARTRAGRFAVAVSGGTTPEPMFRALAAGAAGNRRWDDWHVFWADERAVPPTDPRSNVGAARRLWLAPAAVPPEHVHPIRADGALDAVAERYDAELRGFFGAAGGAATTTFDAVVLGVGPDGHTASLFPGAASLDETSRWVVGEAHPGAPPLVSRVTLTLPAIGRARTVLFLVCGAEKRAVVERIFADPRRGSRRAALPAARVTAQESVEWHLDQAAALPPTGGGRAAGVQTGPASRPARS